MTLLKDTNGNVSSKRVASYVILGIVPDIDEQGNLVL
jgi:hypothetical protein